MCKHAYSLVVNVGSLPVVLCRKCGVNSWQGSKLDLVQELNRTTDQKVARLLAEVLQTKIEEQKG